MQRKILILLMALRVILFNDTQADQTIIKAQNGNFSSPVMSIYQITPGMTLKQGLSLWGEMTKCQINNVPHWQVFWKSGVDYSVDAPLIFHQEFLPAMSRVINLYSRAQIPLYAHIYQQQCLIVIDTH